MLVQNLAKVKRSNRNATAASLVIIAAFAMYNWAVTPHSANLSSAKAYESVMDNVAKQRRIMATKVEIKRKTLKRLSEQSEQILNMLFTPDKAREFFSDIEVISVETGCIVEGINFINHAQKSEYRDFGIRLRSAELNVVGLYTDIAKLIRRLQTRSQKVWFDALELKSIDYSSDKVRCRLTVTICEIVDEGTS
jgi:Tfp pilus assembly protein PilO